MSTHTIIRPTGTNLKSTGNANPTGAASVQAAISDASDATFAQATVGSTELYYDLGAVTVATTQRVNGLKIFARSNRNATNVAQDVGYWLSLWPKTSPHTTEWRDSRKINSIATASSPEFFTPPGLTTEWTQALVNKTAIRFKWYLDANGNTNFQKVYDIWVDVELISQASVTGSPVVTNFTNSALPNVAWVFNDPDGGGQVAYEVKIFDAATMANGSFDVNKTTPAWTSGQTVAGDTNVDATTPLQNGVTYTAFVRVAKFGPKLPNVSRYWWSIWAASSTFTITFTPPFVPVIQSASVITDESLYRALLKVQAPVNLLTLDNSSFEGSLGDWVAVSNCAVARDTAQFADGVASLKLTSSGAGVMQARANLDSLGQPTVYPGQQYTAMAAFKAQGLTRSAAVGLQWLAPDGTTVISGPTFGTAATDNAVNFSTQVFYTATCPAGAARAKIYLQLSTPAASGEVHWADKMSVAIGSSFAWTPGGYTNDQTGIIIERGEMIDDQRGPALNWFTEQVGSTASMTRNPGQGFQFTSPATDLKWAWLDKAIGRAGYTASGMLIWSVFTGANNMLRIGLDFYGRPLYSPPVVANQPHTFSVWAWTDGASHLVRPGIEWRDINGAFLGVVNGANVTLTTTPQRLQITATSLSASMLGNGFVQDMDSIGSNRIFISTAGFGLGSNPVDQYQPMGLDAGIHWRQIQFVGNTANTLDTSGFPVGGIAQTEGFPDFEYPSGRPVWYRAWITYSTSTTLLRSAYATTVQLYGNPPARTILRSVTDNTLGCVINRRKSLSMTFVSDSTVYHPLGADGAPIRVRDWQGGEDGVLELVISTDAQYQRIRELITSTDVFQIQWGNGGRTYIIITDASMSETYSEDATVCDIDGYVGALRYVVLQLTYVETQSPLPTVTVQ